MPPLDFNPPDPLGGDIKLVYTMPNRAGILLVLLGVQGRRGRNTLELENSGVSNSQLNVSKLHPAVLFSVPEVQSPQLILSTLYKIEIGRL